jgi:hypothetical protein
MGMGAFRAEEPELFESRKHPPSPNAAAKAMAGKRNLDRIDRILEICHEKERVHHPLAPLARDAEDTEKTQIIISHRPTQTYTDGIEKFFGRRFRRFHRLVTRIAGNTRYAGIPMQSIVVNGNP